MRVFLAGATGVIGRPLIGLLRHAGHEVTGTTRSSAKIAEIEALGATGVAVDAFDAEGLRRACGRAASRSALRGEEAEDPVRA